MIKLVNPWTRLGERNINYAAHRPVRWLLGRHKRRAWFFQRVGWRDNTFQQQKNVSAAPSVFLFPCCAPSIPPSLSVLASVVISDGGTVGEPVNTRRSNKVSNSGFWFSSNRIFRIEICTRTRRNSTTPGEPNEMKTNSRKQIYMKGRNEMRFDCYYILFLNHQRSLDTDWLSAVSCIQGSYYIFPLIKN